MKRLEGIVLPTLLVTFGVERDYPNITISDMAILRYGSLCLCFGVICLIIDSFNIFDHSRENIKIKRRGMTDTFRAKLI